MMLLYARVSGEPEDTDAPVERSLELLREALSIADKENWPSEIGARLDHVICSIEELKERPATKA